MLFVGKNGKYPNLSGKAYMGSATGTGIHLRNFDNTNIPLQSLLLSKRNTAILSFQTPIFFPFQINFSYGKIFSDDGIHTLLQLLQFLFAEFSVKIHGHVGILSKAFHMKTAIFIRKALTHKAGKNMLCTVIFRLPSSKIRIKLTTDFCSLRKIRFCILPKLSIFFLHKEKLCPGNASSVTGLSTSLWVEEGFRQSIAKKGRIASSPFFYKLFYFLFGKLPLFQYNQLFFRLFPAVSSLII